MRVYSTPSLTTDEVAQATMAAAFSQRTLVPLRVRLSRVFHLIWRRNRKLQSQVLALRKVTNAWDALDVHDMLRSVAEPKTQWAAHRVYLKDQFLDAVDELRKFDSKTSKQ